MPTPNSVSQNTPITIRMPFITDGLTPLFGGTGKGTTSDVNTANPAIIVSRTAKTIMDMRAQYFSRHRPIPVNMPHTAGNRYTSATDNRMTLKRIGGTGNWLEPGTGAKAITASMKIPIAN